MWEEKKQLKSLIRFHSVNKINNYNRGSGKRKKVKKKIQKNLQNKSKHKNNKCFSWVTAVRVLSLIGSHSPPYLPRMPSNTVLISGPVVGAAAAAVTVTLVVSDSVRPIDGNPPGSPVPGILQAEHRTGLPFPSPVHESEKWKWSCSAVSDS